MFGFKSESFTATFGVPQGGHLSVVLFALTMCSVSKVPRYWELLCFADGIKIFRKVKILSRIFSHLQDDLDKLVMRGYNIGLFFNVNKCKSMSYSRCRLPRKISFSFNDAVLSSFNEIYGLRFVFVSSLCPKAHTHHNFFESTKTSSFIMRVAAEWWLSRSLNTLFCALECPLLSMVLLSGNLTQRYNANELSESSVSLLAALDSS